MTSVGDKSGRRYFLHPRLLERTECTAQISVVIITRLQDAMDHSKDPGGQEKDDFSGQLDRTGWEGK